MPTDPIDDGQRSHFEREHPFFLEPPAQSSVRQTSGKFDVYFETPTFKALHEHLIRYCTPRPMWLLTEAIVLLAQLRPLAQTFGYNLELGGSMLLKGYSENDLDFILHPYNNDLRPQEFLEAVLALPAENAVWTWEADEQVGSTTQLVQGNTVVAFFRFDNPLPRCVEFWFPFHSKEGSRVHPPSDDLWERLKQWP